MKKYVKMVKNPKIQIYLDLNEIWTRRDICGTQSESGIMLGYIWPFTNTGFWLAETFVSYNSSIIEPMWLICILFRAFPFVDTKYSQLFSYETS